MLLKITRASKDDLKKFSSLQKYTCLKLFGENNNNHQKKPTEHTNPVT